MKRALLIILIALPLSAAPEKWVEAYNKGVMSVNGRNYKFAAAELQKAIAEMPNEGTSVRTRSAIITYVPHFWLGIAKFNLGDVDGALREWRISEEQGAIAKTEYYSTMKDWVARAQTEKKRNAQSAASGAKKKAADAVSRAITTQLDALSAGGERTESYRSAQRLLQDARSQFNKAGTDIDTYAAAQTTADKATTLFVAAADEGKKLKAARPANPKPQPPKPQPKPTEAVVPFEDVPVAQKPVETPPVVKVEPKPEPVAPPAPVITQAEADAIVAERKGGRTSRPPLEPAVTATVMPPKSSADLRPAYRAFASGNLAAAEDLLTKILTTTPNGEAYLLRGCARYTRAMLSRTPDAVLATAAQDFKAALQQNRALRLDTRAFSPKLIAYFEQVRNGR
jgi:tetratricopeptide (TPR) repeat protein